MEKENLQVQIIPKKARIRKRSLLCLLILVSALTYFLIPALIFLAGLVYSEKILEIITQYYSPGDINEENFLSIAVTGTLLYFIAVAGILLFILRKKSGFYLFFLASVIIFSLDLYLLEFDWMRYLIHTGFIFILGIAHFSGRCYLKKIKNEPEN